LFYIFFSPFFSPLHYLCLELSPHTNYYDALLRAAKRPPKKPKAKNNEKHPKSEQPKSRKTGQVNNETPKENSSENNNTNQQPVLGDPGDASQCFDSIFRARLGDATFEKLWLASVVAEETYHAAPLWELSNHSV
jgi:hypothetical protein